MPTAPSVPPSELYQARLLVDNLRRTVFERPLAEVDPQTLERLAAEEARLASLEAQAAAASPGGGLLTSFNAAAPGLALGTQTTGLSAEVFLRLEHLPTATCHLFDAETNPLVSCTVNNTSTAIRRLRVTAYIEGYSAHAIQTQEIPPKKEHTFNLLPTLFLQSIRDLNELSRATLNVLVEDLDGKVERHITRPIWLLARTAVPLAVQDPKTKSWQDLSRYLGAFVTPNAQPVLEFLRQVAAAHPRQRLTGYIDPQEPVEAQVRAAYQALQGHAIRYIHSPLAFNPAQGAATQRVRLPGESLADKSANCIDGTVLFASLLEAMALNPALVIVPGHAFLAWAATAAEDAEWKYLETTLVSSKSFEEACATAEALAKQFQAVQQANPERKDLFRRWPLRQLRSEFKIYPME